MGQSIEALANRYKREEPALYEVISDGELRAMQQKLTNELEELSPLKMELIAALEDLTEKESHALTYMEMIDARKHACSEIIDEFEQEISVMSDNIETLSSQKLTKARDFLKNQLPEIQKATEENVKAIQVKIKDFELKLEENETREKEAIKLLDLIDQGILPSAASALSP